MANLDISAEIEEIKKAFEGRQVRQSIVDALTAVQTKLNEYAPAELIYGSTEITADGSTATASKLIDLPFTPTVNTKIIGSVRVAVFRRAKAIKCMPHYATEPIRQALIQLT